MAKYRHRGYKDSDNEERAQRSRGASYEPPKPRLEGAPRGRSSSGPGREVFRCARCGTSFADFATVPANQTCAGCASDLHTCSNCRHYDPNQRFECSMSIRARISPKDKANSCTLFASKVTLDLAGDRPVVRVDEARKAFDDLFKK